MSRKRFVRREWNNLRMRRGYARLLRLFEIRIGMPPPRAIPKPMGIAPLFNIAQSEQRFGVALRNVQHVMRLAETGAPRAQLAHQSLTFGDGHAEMACPRREVEMMQIIGLDACLNERAH